MNTGLPQILMTQTRDHEFMSFTMIIVMTNFMYQLCWDKRCPNKLVKYYFCMCL